MKNFFAALTMMILGAAGSAYASDAQILGRWISVAPVFESNGIAAKLGFDFKETTAAMSTICYYPGGKELEASVTVPTTVADNKIEVLGDGQAKVSDGGFECNSSVKTGRVDYQIADGVLRVSADGQSMDFIRR